MWYNDGMAADWIKEWALPLSAGATFLLALAAAFAIWQNYRFRKGQKTFTLKTTALDEIYRWIMELRITIRLYLIAVKTGDTIEKFRTSSECNDSTVDSGRLLVNAALFGMDFVKTIKTFSTCASKYHEVLGLDPQKPDTLNVVHTAMTNYTDASSKALAEVQIQRIDLFSDVILENKIFTLVRKFRKRINRFRHFLLRKEYQVTAGEEPGNANKDNEG